MNYRRVTVIALGTIGFTGFFGSFVFYRYLMRVSPTMPLTPLQQIYQLNEHGYLFYVTRKQYWLFHTLLIGGWMLGALAAILNYHWKVLHNLTRNGWRRPT